MTHKSQRPENWKNPFIFHGEKNTRPAAFEDGADAMLEALKAKGTLMTPEQMKLIAPDREYPYCWLVAIPEEVE